MVAGKVVARLPPEYARLRVARPVCVFRRFLFECAPANEREEGRAPAEVKEGAEEAVVARIRFRRMAVIGYVVSTARPEAEEVFM